MNQRTYPSRQPDYRIPPGRFNVWWRVTGHIVDRTGNKIRGSEWLWIVKATNVENAKDGAARLFQRTVVGSQRRAVATQAVRDRP